MQFIEFTESEFHSFPSTLFFLRKGLWDRFIGAIDARTKKKIGKEHVLRNNDVIKILVRK